jgi:glycine/D-amino acid oxidase-like deaminating enzyme/nitrite reductase/ring-hydroxylating ferredoxin subunit
MKQNSEDGKLTSGKNVSYWTDTIEHPLSYSPLNENLETDVVIVGGGLAGLSVAYCLSAAGKKVIVVEDGFVGSGETGRTTAQLVTALDDRYYELERIYGENDTKIIANSHKAAIDFVEQTIKKENIDCEFQRVNGYLFLHPTDKKDSLRKELKSALKAGLDVLELDKVPDVLIHAGKCIRFANQAQFHPMKYLNGLCKAIEKNGGRIFTETHAAKINHTGITSGEGFTVKAKHVVIATNAPVNNKFAIMLKQNAYRTYVIGALVEKNAFPYAFWWDTGDHDINPQVPPYHYVRLESYDETRDLILIGGQDHLVGAPDLDISEKERYDLLENWGRKYFSMTNVIYKWSGEVREPMDGLAYIGHNPFDRDNVYIVTGDSGNGMTHCTIAGLLISDLILGKKNEWERIYRPSRFTFKSSGPFFEMLKNDLVNAITKWSSDAEAIEFSAIKKGEGKIVKLFGEKCGAFRDDNDRLHVVSAECTHLKCSVSWNNDEKSWDCPCHGSRFTYMGKVISGPANKNLTSFSEKAVLEEMEAVSVY